MSYKYLRFYLKNNPSIHIHSAKHYAAILENRKEAGYIRASFELNGSEKNFSILCQSKKDILSLQKDWVNYLKTNKIPISKKMEHDDLEDKTDPLANCFESHNHAHHHEHKHDHEDHHGHGHRHGHGHGDQDSHWKNAALGMTVGLCLLALPFIGFNFPPLTVYLLNVLSTLMTLYLGKDLYQSAWLALKNKKIGSELLYTISTLTILGLSITSLIFPSLPLMLESAPLILGFWHLGEAIEHSLLTKINDKLDVRDCAPKTVRLLGKSNKATSVKTLIPNDIILLSQGDVIPVDGVLTQPALLYTTRVNGSPYPKRFNAGEKVKAGMCMAGDALKLEMRVTTLFKNSYLSLIAQNIDIAHKEKAPLEVLTNRVLKYFIPGIIASAVISGIFLGLYFNYALAIQSVISILVSACPCALSLITPMAVRLGMKKSSENGIHFKHGKALQSAANIDAIVFDLNGTLTEGKPTIKTFNIKDKALLKYIAALEAHSDHPASKTILDHIAQQDSGTNSRLKVTQVDKSNHSGIKGVIQGELFMIGNSEMLKSNGIKIIDPAYQNNVNGSCYIVRGSVVVGQISITDCLRKDAVVTVQQLQSMGKQVHICTGADKPTAEYYAKALGIPPANVCANTVGALTSVDEVSKESYIQKLKQCDLKVAMVGDAANDLTAIARADIGVAIKSRIGDKLTEKHAGISIHEGLLFPIITAFDIAQKTKLNIYQNLFASLTYNSLITLAGVGLFIPFGFVLSPGIGVGLMVLESAIVLANLYRLKIQKTISQPKSRVQASNKQSISLETISDLRCTLEHNSRINKAGNKDIDVTAQAVTFSLNSKRYTHLAQKKNNKIKPSQAHRRNRIASV